MLNDLQLFNALRQLAAGDQLIHLTVGGVTSSVIGLAERIEVLLEQEGLPGNWGNHVAHMFGAAWEETGGLPVEAGRLRRVFEDSVVATKGGDIVESFRSRIIRMALSEDHHNVALVDSLEAVAPPDHYRKFVVTDPILRWWPREILNDSAWNTIESPVPGVEGLPIAESWVDLGLTPLGFQELTRGRTAEMKMRTDFYFDNTGMLDTVEEVILQTRGLVGILGFPGSGKSTTIRWITRYLLTESECPFGIPVVISLRRFAKARATESSLTLFEFFLRERGVSHPEQIGRWANLLERSHDPNTRKHLFFWLLDGWDEVPAAQRDSLIPQIQAIKHCPGILTTRHSADPLALGLSRYFEIAGLTRHAAVNLAKTWLTGTGRQGYYRQVADNIDSSPDLRKLARSPFLLTLYCAVISAPLGLAPKTPPESRFELFGNTLELIRMHHNGDDKQTEKLTDLRFDIIKKFSWWLFREAEGAPRYLFDEGDFEKATGDPLFFRDLLKPSRLVARPFVFSDDFQFIHTTFQEYLAAAHLVNNVDLLRATVGQKALFDANLREILRFLAGFSKSKDMSWFWSTLRQVATRLDLYGLLAARLAILAAEAGARDGGEALLGVDLRPVLWNLLIRHGDAQPLPLVDAFLELDPEDYIRRVLDQYMVTGESSRRVAWLRQAPDRAVEKVACDSKYSALRHDPVICEWIEFPESKGESEDPEFDAESNCLEARLDRSHRLEDAAGFIAAYCELQLLNSDEALEQATSMLGDFGTHESEALLLEVALAPETHDIIRGTAVSAVLKLGSRSAGNRLVTEMAIRDLDDPVVRVLVQNLEGHTLSDPESNLILSILEHSHDEDVRDAAALLLESSRLPGLGRRLLALFQSEMDPEVRFSILKSLGYIADPDCAEPLWEWVTEHKLNTENERQEAFLAILETVIRPANRHLDRIRTEAIRLVSTALESPGHPMAGAASRAAGIIGDEILPVLIKATESQSHSADVLIRVARALGEIGDRRAIPVLLAVLNRPDDFEHEDELTTLKEAAAISLGSVAPEVLLGLTDSQSDLARAKLAYERDILFFSDDVVNSSGVSLFSANVRISHQESKMIQNADVALYIALNEELKLFIKHFGPPTRIEEASRVAATFYHFEVQSVASDRAWKLVAVSAGAMGKTRSASLTSRMLEIFNPPNLVILGIAGSCHTDDLQLGDIFIPNQINDYLALSAAVERPIQGRKGGKQPNMNRAWSFQLSGNSFRANSRLTNRAQNFSQKSPDQWKNYQAASARMLKEQLDPKKFDLAVKRGLCRESSFLVAGDDKHLASGDVVGKAADFTDWLKENSDRKTAAIEMESAGAFDAAEIDTGHIRAISIRGISDFADYEKAEIQKTYSGVFRDIAVANATQFLRAFIAADGFREEIARSCESSQ